MRQTVLLGIVALGLTGCSTPSAQSVTGPSLSVQGSLSSLAPSGSEANSCPDGEIVQWVYPTSQGAVFRPVWNIETYEVEAIRMTDDGPALIGMSFQNGSEIALPRSERWGKVFLSVRTKNRCDQPGPWNAALLVDFDDLEEGRSDHPDDQCRPSSKWPGCA